MEKLEFKGTKDAFVFEKAKESATINVPLNGAYVVVSDGEVKALCGIGLKEEHKANAQLFAASKDLLEACIEALKELRYHGWANNRTGFQLEAAISKALNTTSNE